MKARVKWLDGVAFVGESGSGHSVVMDGVPEAGGRDIGIRPMEMLLIGLGGCTAFDVMHILRRGRVTIDDCVVDVEAERATEDPKVFTSIRLRFTVSGPRLPLDKVERAVHLSAEKYCSASIMLGKTATITHDIAIVDTAAGRPA
jgi:putative redox protein